LHGGDEVFVVQVSVAEVEPDQRVAWWGLSRGVTPYRSTCSASNPIRSNVTGGTGTGLPNFSDKSAATCPKTDKSSRTLPLGLDYS